MSGSGAHAAVSDTLNFQGRLATNTGGLVSDGSYNIEFTIYDDASAGTSQWSETQSVTVRNGYFSVYLGEVTPFGGSIPWDQELWMTMNVNSDGEMSPRIKLTAVPYAFRAGAVTDATGNAFTGDDLAQLAPSNVQAVNSALAALRLNQTGSGGLLQLQDNGTDVFTIGNDGLTTIDSGLILGNTSTATAGAIRWTGVDFQGYDGSSWVSLTSGSAPSSGDPVTATFYDAAGGATVTTSFSTINLDSTLTNSDNTLISLATDEVTVTEDGYYEVSYQVTSQLAGGTRSGFNAKLQLDDGGGFVDVVGSQAYHYGRITSETQGTSSATVVLDLTAGDTIRIQGRGTSQSFTTIANATSLSISKVTSAGGSGSGLEFTQNGNAFGSTAILGTTDNNGLRFITNNNIALDFTATGDATFFNALDVDGLLTANNGLTVTSGNLNLSGGDIQNAGAITATSISGDGSGLTSLNGSAITTGTLADARLSSNVALLDTAQTYTGLSNFSAGLTVGNTANTTAGNIRWTGTDLEVYDGTSWVSLTSGSSPAGVAVYTGTFVITSTGTTSISGLPFEPDTVTFRSNVSVDGLNVDQAGPTNGNDTDNYAGAMNGYARDTGSGIEQQVTQDGGSGNSINAVTSFSSSSHVIGVRYGDNDGTQVGEIKGQFDSFTSDGFDINVTDYSVGAGTSGMVVMYTAYGSGSAGGSGSGLEFTQNGNAFGSTAILGTTDNNGLRFITNNNIALDFTATGDATFFNALDVDGLLTANNGLTVTSGNLNLSGGDIQNAGAITATSISGDGSGLTSLNGSAITTGTLADARLSSNVALLDTAQTYTGLSNFSAGLTVGNTANTTAGNIRWTGTDLEVYDGTSWVSLTSGGASQSDYISETITANSNTATGPYDVFESGNYAAFSSVTNASDGIVYTPVDGRFTIANDGVYNIQANLLLENSTISLMNILVRVNGSDVYNHDTFIHNVVDPVERTVTTIQDLSAGDYVEFLVQGTSGTITVNGGSSATIVPVSAASGGGGGGGSAFEQGGNAFGSLGILGTTDSSGLQIITNGSPALEFTAGGDASFTNALEVDGLLTANNGLTLISGNLNLNGGDITNGGSITATSFTGDGSGLTSLSGSAITTGTISSTRLASDVAFNNIAQSFSGLQTFTGGLTLGNTVTATAGTIRWTGTDFEGYDGTQWISLSSSSSAPLLEGVLAFGKVNSNGAALNVNGATTVRNSTGNYTVTLDTAATNANYTVLLSVQDATNYNDINIVLDNQTTTTFDVYIREGDNGTGSDVARDRVWHFTVLDPDAVVGGGPGPSGNSFEQNGNAFGSTAILGTTDNNGLRFVTNTNNVMEFTAAGDGTIANALDVNGLLSANSGLSVTSGNANLNGGDIQNAGTISAATSGDTINGLIVNSGSLSGITGYNQASGNFTISGSGTFATGTGDIDLNGDVTAASTIYINDGLSVAGTNSNVNSAGYFEANITTGSSINNGTTFGPYTFDADNDADEAAWTFVSTNGANGLNPSGTNRAWSHDTNDTPSADVGPTSGQGGNPDGYIYTEATAPAAGNDTFTVTNNTAFDASSQGLLIEFYWNQRGTDNLATLDVQTNENGGGWVTRGSYGGGDQATGGPSIWNFEQLNLDGVVSDPSTEVRFLVTFPAGGTIWNNDFGLDTITITELEPDVYGDNVIEAYNANAVSDVDLLVLRSDVGGVNNVKFRVDSDGDIFSDGLSFIGGGADLAEMYKNNDNAQPGDVVVFTNSRTVARSSQVNQKAVAGIVSTYPGIVLDAKTKGVPVALSGRAPVNFSTENGTIEAGDYLMSGPDGTAVKATSAGTIIGRAMSGMSQDGSVDVMVGISYYNPAIDEVAEGGLTTIFGSSSPIEQLLLADMIRINAESSAVEIDRLQINDGIVVSGGLRNSFDGIKDVGDVLGAWTVEARDITLQAMTDESVLEVVRDGEGRFTLNGDGSLGIRVDSSSAFKVQDREGLDLFSVNTDGGIVQIGNQNSSPSAILFVLARKNTAGDPVGVNGAQYYNEHLQRFRCYQDDQWVDCVPAAVTEYILLSSPATWSLQPEEAEIAGGARTWLDLRTAREARIIVSVSSAAIPGSTCKVQFQLDGSDSWESLFAEEQTINIDETGAIRGEWSSVAPDARGAKEVLLRTVCAGGDGLVEVSIATVRLQLR